MNRIKIIHFDEEFWLYYYRFENGKLKWPRNSVEALNINKEELSLVLKGYEIRIKSKFKPVTERNFY